MGRKIAVLFVIALAALPMAAAQAASLPSGFTDSDFASEPDGAGTSMAWAPDGSNRLFVLDQGGNGYIIKNGSLLPNPFVALTVDSSGERGLLGIAFDPSFSSNNFIYLYYTTTDDPNPHNRVSRFTMTGDTAGSELDLLDLPALGATNHNGGSLHFGQDGKLYIGVGDNARNSGSDIVSPDLSIPLGKILRINSDGTIPANPFNGTPGADHTIWAKGLRNPYTFAFDSGSTKMFINDVGQNTWEEIDSGVAGADYGWPTMEGTHCYLTNPCSQSGLTLPIYTYAHGAECAITGAEFYRPPVHMFPSSYEGKYFFSDFCAGWIRMMDPTTHQVTTFADSTAGSVVDLDTGPDGALYYLSNDGSVHVITYSNTPPTVHIVSPASSTLYRVGSTITFSAQATDIDQKSFPKSAFTWSIDQVDPSIPSDVVISHPTGPSGTFKVPVTSDKSTTVQYQFTVTVTDNGSATATDTVTLSPQLVNLSFDTNPPGQSFSLDGASHTAPFSMSSIIGMPYTLSAPSQVEVSGALWQFQMWKPGGLATHTLKTPVKDTAYLANYVQRQILNGSFESAIGKTKRPASWSIASFTSSDGLDCATPAQDLLCSLQLNGGSKSKSASQKLSLVGGSGDSLTLDFWWKASGASAGGFSVNLVILNSNNTKTVASFTLPAGDNAWTEQTVNVLGTRPYRAVQVTIVATKGASGQAWFDDLSLATP